MTNAVSRGSLSFFLKQIGRSPVKNARFIFFDKNRGGTFFEKTRRGDITLQRQSTIRAAEAATSLAIPDKKYYTDDELCDLFSVSKRTTARWRESGMIGFLRAPGSTVIRYSRQHLLDFEARLEHRAKKEKGRP
jgi:hypothetical protein